MKKVPKEVIEKITKELVDKGLLIEAGWQSLRLMSIPENASQAQVDDMRSAFFAGAQHLFASIITMLEPDSEPTDKDLNRIDLIANELNEFIRIYKTTHKLG